MYRSKNSLYGLNEPLFLNSFLGNVCISNSIVKLCMMKGFNKMGHLINLDLKERRSAQEITRQVELRSVRVVVQLILGLKAALPPPLFQFFFFIFL